MNRRAALLAALLVPVAARADDTQVLPRGVWMLDLGYLHSTLDERWGANREALPLIDPIPRYLPGGGYQGTVSATPVVTYAWFVPQLFYGITEQLTAGAVLPICVQTRVSTHLGWTPGDYNSELGRPYSESDFWQWAASMGQPKPPDAWIGNRWTPGDLLLVGRWQFARRGLLERWDLTAAASLSVALPTGKNPEPEQVVTAGTNAWEVHSYGDIDPHLALKKTLWRDGEGLERFALGVDLFYAWFRPRTYVTPTGSQNPLLLQYQPYVGDTYQVKGGDWLAATVSADVALVAGRTHPRDGLRLPPLLSATLTYTYVSTSQSWWRSDSAQWDYQRELQWQPGDKHIFRGVLTASLLRLGVPIELYASATAQDIVPGRFTRAADTVGAGARVLGKFW